MGKYLAGFIGVAVAIGIGYAIMNSSNTDSMQKDGDTMMEDDAMMDDSKSEDAMMKDDMTKSEDTMMKDDAMKSEDSMMKDETMMKDEGAMMSDAKYVAYTDGVVGNGKKSVLFFHASWCPSCQQADKDLASIYGAHGASVNTYKVNYDTETALKQKYGVTYQHTFVVIDGDGKALQTVTGPSATQLAALVK